MLVYVEGYGGCLLMKGVMGWNVTLSSDSGGYSMYILQFCAGS